MEAPHYFCYHNEVEIRETLSKLPFEIISLSYADKGKWMHIIMKSNLQHS